MDVFMGIVRQLMCGTQFSPVFYRVYMSSFSESFSYKICTHKGHATGTNSLEVRKRTMYKVYMVRLRTSIF